MDLDQLRGRRILILGTGREGLSSFTFVRHHLPSAHIAVADRTPAQEVRRSVHKTLEELQPSETYFGPDYLSAVDEYDVIIKSAGVRPDLPELVAAEERGTTLTSNVDIFFSCCPGTIIGVTGTKGKSTTSSLIYAVLDAAGIDARLTGNIGLPPLTSLTMAGSRTVFVVELSSYQLMSVHRSPHIAVVQNIFQEHIDYHGSFANYLEAKRSIVRYQEESDFVIYNAENEHARAIAFSSSGEKIAFSRGELPESRYFVRDGNIVWREDGVEQAVLLAADVPLTGSFNLLSVMPAVAIAMLKQLPIDSIRHGVRHFHPLEHRLEHVMKVDEVVYINDSLSTIPESAAAALEAVEGRNVILIAGGYDRGQDYSLLAKKLLDPQVRALVSLPPTGQRIWDAVEAEADRRNAGAPALEHVRAATMGAAVRAAHNLSKPGDVVLLSPAAPSFGMFKDYAERGSAFRRAVKELAYDRERLPLTAGRGINAPAGRRPRADGESGRYVEPDGQVETGSLLTIERVELMVTEIPLLRTFETSSSKKACIRHVLIKMHANGLIGWGEAAVNPDPYYCEETTETCWHILREFLVPAVLGKRWRSIDEFVDLYQPVKRNYFAKAGLEMAAWDLVGKARGEPVSKLLEGTRAHIETGVSLGISEDIHQLYGLIERYLDEGYRRIKLKIRPGWDTDVVGSVRERYPDVPLVADANAGYTLHNFPAHEMDGYELLAIEQPLSSDDLYEHACLQGMMSTPICLDESIQTQDDAKAALELHSCRMVNVKVSRLGGLFEARRVHNLCLYRDTPLYCGGMHEFGVGRAANLALASLKGFSVPGDVSGSDKYFEEDIITEPILAHDGLIAVPTGPGLGVVVDETILKRYVRCSAKLPT